MDEEANNISEPSKKEKPVIRIKSVLSFMDEEIEDNSEDEVLEIEENSEN